MLESTIEIIIWYAAQWQTSPPSGPWRQATKKVPVGWTIHIVSSTGDATIVQIAVDDQDEEALMMLLRLWWILKSDF